MAQFPGTLMPYYYIQDLFDATSDTFACKFIGTGRPNADIAILEVLGDYRLETYLEVKQPNLKAEDRSGVDVIGYPGLYDDQYARSMNRAATRHTVEDLLELLPKRQLIITHGPLVHCGIMPTYRLSTVGGMSGGPVILNGQVIGKDVTGYTTDRLLVGVHVGVSSRQTNHCVALGWEEVWKLLKAHGVVGEILEFFFLTDYSGRRPGDVKESAKGSWLKNMFTKGEAAKEGSKEQEMPSHTQSRHQVHRLSKSVNLNTPY